MDLDDGDLVNIEMPLVVIRAGSLINCAPKILMFLILLMVVVVVMLLVVVLIRMSGWVAKIPTTLPRNPQRHPIPLMVTLIPERADEPYLVFVIRPCIVAHSSAPPSGQAPFRP